MDYWWCWYWQLAAALHRGLRQQILSRRGPAWLWCQPLKRPQLQRLPEQRLKPTKPVGQPADAKAAIGAALDALDKNGPYRMTIMASSDAGGPVTLDVVPPDRSWYKGSVDGKPVEVIDIGNTSYVLDPDGTWQTSTTTDASASDMLMDPAILNALTNVEILPQETINGTPTTVYSFVDPTSPDVKVTLWVSQDKGRPVQMQMATSDETVLYVIVYDAGIKVEAPVK